MATAETRQYRMVKDVSETGELLAGALQARQTDGEGEGWVAAVNADGKHGFWQYRMVKDVSETGEVLAGALQRAKGKG